MCQNVKATCCYICRCSCCHQTRFKKSNKCTDLFSTYITFAKKNQQCTPVYRNYFAYKRQVFICDAFLEMYVFSRNES